MWPANTSMITKLYGFKLGVEKMATFNITRGALIVKPANAQKMYFLSTSNSMACVLIKSRSAGTEENVTLHIYFTDYSLPKTEVIPKVCCRNDTGVYLSLTKPSMMSLAWTSMMRTVLYLDLSFLLSGDRTCTVYRLTVYSTCKPRTYTLSGLQAIL